MFIGILFITNVMQTFPVKWPGSCDHKKLLGTMQLPLNNIFLQTEITTSPFIALGKINTNN